MNSVALLAQHLMDVVKHKIGAIMVGGLITPPAKYYTIDLCHLSLVDKGLGDISKEIFTNLHMFKKVGDHFYYFYGERWTLQVFGCHILT